MRIASVFITIAALAVSLFGCAISYGDMPIAGEDLILRAREEYVALDSARVDVINDDTGNSEQIFIFKYDEKGIMTYSYIGNSEGVYLAQYNNGHEQFTNDNGFVTVTGTGDADFAAYSRDVPYPLADEGLILYYKKAVNPELSYIASNEQATEVCHVYDISKLNGSGVPAEATGFAIKYYFDGDGNLLYFTEITDMTVDGQEKTYSYTIYITERDAVERVSNVVDISDYVGDVV